MSLRITVAETALAGIGFTFVGSYLTYLATRRGSREATAAQERTVDRTIAAQRELARSERLFERRYQLYLPVLDQLHELRHCAGSYLYEFREPSMEGAANEFIKAQIDVMDHRIEVTLLAEDDATQAWSDVEEATWTLRMAIGQAGDRGESLFQNPSLASPAKDVMDHVDKLTGLLRSEVRGT